MRSASLPRPMRPSWWMADVAVSSVLTVALVAGLVHRDAGLVSYLAGTVLTTTVAWRRLSPEGAVVTGLVAASLFRDAGQLAQSVLMPAVVVLTYYLLGARSAARKRLWLDVALLILVVPLILSTPGDQGPVDFASVWLFFFLFPFLAGLVIAAQRRAGVTAAQEADQAEREQHDRAQHAIVGERARIARDLHDVVAHNVSVMAIQATAARRAAPIDPDAARTALAAVAACGREALVEMRGIVGVVRRADELGAGHEPGLDQLEALAERSRLSGVPVELEVRGTPRPLSPARDLVAFRVVQESLTNVLKHAGAASASVCIDHRPDCVQILVVDDGRRLAAEPVGGPDRPAGQLPGHGLVGMRERVTLFGGTVDAGRRSPGGYQVVARIPRSEADPR